jgi:SNF2 family DNA or RNA helicase
MSWLVDAFKAADPMAMTILDEAHFLKNTQSNRTRAVLLGLRKTFGRLTPMSATPAPNHAGELYAILRIARPDLIISQKTGKPMREDEFIDRYVQMKTIRVNDRLVEVVEGSKNVPELRERVSGFFMRLTKKQALPDLPPLAFDVLPVKLSANLPHLNLRGTDDEILAALNAGGGPIATVTKRLGYAKAPAVAEYVRDWLEGNLGRQHVVWAVHHIVIDHLMTMLADFSPSKVDGRDPLKARADAIERFVDGKTRLFIGQIMAGGTAVTLVGPNTKCSDVLFAESSFSPSDNYQAACRVHRIGQRDGVLARFASAVGTFDDRIQEIQARKAQDFFALFEHQETREGGANP